MIDGRGIQEVDFDVILYDKKKNDIRKYGLEEVPKRPIGHETSKSLGPRLLINKYQWISKRIIRMGSMTITPRSWPKREKWRPRTESPNLMTSSLIG